MAFLRWHSKRQTAVVSLSGGLRSPCWSTGLRMRREMRSRHLFRHQNSYTCLLPFLPSAFSLLPVLYLLASLSLPWFYGHSGGPCKLCAVVRNLSLITRVQKKTACWKLKSFFISSSIPVYFLYSTSDQTSGFLFPEQHISFSHSGNLKPSQTKVIPLELLKKQNCYLVYRLLHDMLERLFFLSNVLFVLYIYYQAFHLLSNFKVEP